MFGKRKKSLGIKSNEYDAQPIRSTIHIILPATEEV